MSDELKSCPFCGGEPKLKRHDDTFSVICAYKLKVAEVTDDDALRGVMQGLFGGDWK